MNGVEQTLIGGVGAGTAILLPALGELIGERAGVVNLGTEGCMLGRRARRVLRGGPKRPAACGSASLAGIVVGALVGLVHAWMIVRRGADQLASGLLLWFLALGLTSVVRHRLRQSSASRRCRTSRFPGCSTSVDRADPLRPRRSSSTSATSLVALIWFVFYRTRVGLIAARDRRATRGRRGGRRPSAARPDARGHVGAGLGGLGGAQLSVGYVGNWFNNMTNGYGFVAVAVVLFAAWRPFWVLVGAYLFGVVLAAASGPAGPRRRGQPVPARRAAVPRDPRRAGCRLPGAAARGARSARPSAEPKRRLAVRLRFTNPRGLRNPQFTRPAFRRNQRFLTYPQLDTWPYPVRYLVPKGPQCIGS